MVNQIWCQKSTCFKLNLSKTVTKIIKIYTYASNTNVRLFLGSLVTNLSGISKIKMVNPKWWTHTPSNLFYGNREISGHLQAWVWGFRGL